MLSYQKWGLSAVWSGDSDGVEDKQSPQVQFQFFILIFFFLFRKEKNKTNPQQQFDIWSRSVLWTVVHSLSLSFFICSLLFTFSWHVSIVNGVAA